MKQGDRVSFYLEKTYTTDKNKKPYGKQYSGTVIRFNELVVEILPDGKRKAVQVPKQQVFSY